MTVQYGFVGYRLYRVHERAVVERFFPSVPDSFALIDHGQERSILGDGSYCLVFKIDEKELHEMLQENEFSPIGININPNHWRLDLCNSVVTRIIGPQFQVDPTLLCFSNRTERTDARVIYNTNEDLAIVLGSGRYK